MNDPVLSPLRKLSALALLAALSAVMTATVARSANCPGADREALAWLDKMSRSLHEVSYHGVVTLQRGEDLQVMQVSHAVKGDSSSEQLTTLTGQGAQVERADHPLHCVHPGHRLLQIGAQLQAGECGIAEHYRFRVAEGERIAGRSAVRILVEPRDVYRFGYVMELDRETGLLLKTQTIGPGDAILERFQFASLSLGNRPVSATDVNVVHRAQHSLPDPGAEATVGWSVHWVPGGFIDTDSPATAAGRRTYTDGLSVFSVFMEELSREIRPGEGVVRTGGTVSYTRGMDLSGRPVLVLSLIHISEPTRPPLLSRMPSSA